MEGFSGCWIWRVVGALEGVPGLQWAPYQPHTSRIYPTPGNERPAPSDMHQRRVLPKDGGLLDLELSEDPHLLDSVHGVCTVHHCTGTIGSCQKTQLVAKIKNEILQYQSRKRLCHLHTPKKRILTPKERMANLEHSLCQRGPSMQERATTTLDGRFELTLLV